MKTYLIRMTSDYQTRPIYKIGRSKNVKKRLKQISSGSISAYSILGVIDKDVEAIIHNKLNQYRIKSDREWFDFDKQTLDSLVLPMFNGEPINLMGGEVLEACLKIMKLTFKAEWDEARRLEHMWFHLRKKLGLTKSTPPVSKFNKMPLSERYELLKSICCL